MQHTQKSYSIKVTKLYHEGSNYSSDVFTASCPNEGNKESAIQLAELLGKSLPDILYHIEVIEHTEEFRTCYVSKIGGIEKAKD